MKRVEILLLMLTLGLHQASVPAAAAADTPTRGAVTGAVTHQAPAWFKQSFLEIADDVEEAGDAGRHVILFFQLNDCPYCDRMLSESFESEPLTSYIREHFDTIAINIRGDREIAFNEEITVTEKQLAEILKVSATPAILFLDENNQPIHRADGYRAPQRFRALLEFVATRAYQNTALEDFLRARLDRSAYRLRDNPLFSAVTDLSSVDGPVMLIFEDGSCYDCNEFHDGVLADERVRRAIEPFTIVRLDADSTQSMVDFHGKPTTPAELARAWEVIYRPGVLAFDDGALIRRHDSLIYPFHFSESMRFVAGGHYRETDFRSYSARRTEELLESGIDIDLGRPAHD